MLDKKLQLRDGQSMALVGRPVAIALLAPIVPVEQADALMVFVVTEAELREHLALLQEFAGYEKLTWLAYPKAGQLDTDMNRDTIRAFANAHGLDPVRQVAIDEFWSALRLKAVVL